MLQRLASEGVVFVMLKNETKGKPKKANKGKMTFQYNYDVFLDKFAFNKLGVVSCWIARTYVYMVWKTRK